MFKIYLITNLVTTPNICYVGITHRTLDERFGEHVNQGRRGSNCLLHKDLIYYGTKNFKMEILCAADDYHEALKKETEYIKTLQTHYLDGVGYNMTYSSVDKPIKYAGFTENEMERVYNNLKSGRNWGLGISRKNEIAKKISETKIYRQSIGRYKNSYGHAHTENTIKKMCEIKKEYYKKNKVHNKAQWKMIDAEGNFHVVEDLPVWCLLHKIPLSTARRSLKHNRKLKNGYKIVEKII